MERDLDVDAALLRALLRYFRSGETPGAVSGHGLRREDLHYLRVQWAKSQCVTDLANAVITNHRRIPGALHYRRAAVQGRIRGQLLALETHVGQLLSGNPCLHVVREPRRDPGEGTWRVIEWVLAFAMAHLSPPGARRLGSRLPDELEASRSLVSRALRARDLIDVSPSHKVPVRPGSREIARASNHRDEVARLAAEACRQLSDVESLSPERVRALLSETLIAPQEAWRCYEMFVALRIGEALENATGVPYRLSLVAPLDDGQPLVECGRLSVHWQRRTKLYRAPDLEPSERRVLEICQAIGLSERADRPDLVVTCDGSTAVGIIEVKHSFGASGRDQQLREAISQIVRYTRCYESATAALVCMRALPPGIAAGQAVPTAPHLADFDTLGCEHLRHWAGATTSLMPGLPHAQRVHRYRAAAFETDQYPSE